MALAATGSLTSALVFMGIFWIGGALAKDFLCNDRYIDSKDGIDVRCFYMSSTPATWHEAFNYCHNRRGWMANTPSTGSAADGAQRIGRELMAYNGVYTIWTGLRVKDYRLLEDDFPTPSKFAEPGQIWNTTVTHHNCVIEECALDANTDAQGIQPERFLPRKCAGRGGYRKRFAACDEKHTFGCYFSGVDLNKSLSTSLPSSVPGNDLIRVYDEYFLPVQFYLTRNKTPFGESDDSCGQLFDGGTTFRVSGRTPLDSLNLIAQAFNFNASQSDYYDRNLHWFKQNGDDCFATSLAMAHSQMNKGYGVTSWPCNTTLPAVCQKKRTFSAETTIALFPSFLDERLQHETLKDEIQGAFSVFREHIIQGEGQFEKRLTLQCFVSQLKPGQRVTAYRGGIPLQTFSQLAEGQQSFSIPLRGQFRLSEAADLLEPFYCEINNEENNKLITSNRIYLRDITTQILSFHISCFSNASNIFLWAMYRASLSNQLALGEFELPPTETDIPSEVSQGSVLDRLTFISRWQTMPTLFLPRDESHPNRLVFYLFTTLNFVDERQFSRKKRQAGQSFIPEEQDIANAEREIREILSKNAATFAPLDPSTVRLFSIDWCWEKVVYDESTNRNYSLTKSPGWTGYQSPQTCAQDNKPLVTVRCLGDKTVGFDWGPLEVNPLCSYTAANDSQSEITNSLQSISQENINASNVDDYLNETKVLTNLLTTDTVNTKDILYVADILQKSSETGILSPKAAQDFLDTVDKISGFKHSSLSEAQEIGKATNRILQSVDKLGQQLDVGQSSKYQRIISGQYGLEVWNLTGRYEESPIVGLKILSNGNAQALSKDDMISLFSPDALDHGKTEAAILLPKELIMSILEGDSSEDFRLSMNVYRDTSLYTASASDRNRTLNSKVIAAQLLRQGNAITDLGSYKVITVFLPNVRVKEESRSDLSVCAYWDYGANQGAGDWATDGCEYERTEFGRDICVCDHLTNFAVLLNFYSQEAVTDEHQLALSVITIVGLSLSIIGLSLSILSFLCIKKLRKGRPQQTLFNLALALLLSWIVFLAGIDRTESHGGCIAVAAILHYLIMASFMWMLMEGLLQYLLFVRVMNTYFTKYMLKTGIPAWGLPIIPVIIVFAIDPDLYRGGEEYCWMSQDAFYYAFAIPVGLIVLINLIIFILVVVSLCKRRDLGKSSSQSNSQTVVNIRASFICFFVLGMSWIFGFLTLEEARTVFQYLFCIFGTLQGFIIFLMMTARDKTVQQFWKNLCCRCCMDTDKGRSYRTSNDKGTGSSAQSSQQIPRLQKDKSGSYQGSTQVTSNTSLSVSEGDAHEKNQNNREEQKFP